MILIDNTQIILSSIFSQYKGPDEVNEEMIRHITLNTYRYYLKRFHEEYGELVKMPVIIGVKISFLITSTTARRLRLRMSFIGSKFLKL